MSDYINTSLQPPSGARLSWDAMDNPAPSSFAAPAGCATCHKEPKLSAPYVMWRLMWWMKAKNLTYAQIDDLVRKGEITPCDCHMQ